jgi:hypothetical protein
MTSGVQTGLAFVVAFTGLCLLFLVVDPTPLLVEPEPDLDWPMGLLGVGLGLWSAHRITNLPYVQKRRIGAVALWVMLPLWLSFGLVALGDRSQEALSFEAGGLVEEVTVLVGEKSRSSGRRLIYDVDVISPDDERKVSVRIDEATFNRLKPHQECATVLIERAPNGAARLLRPLEWNVSCPWTSGAD